MARYCRLTCLKMEGKNLLKYACRGQLATRSAYDPALRWAQKLLRVVPGLPSTDFWKKIQNNLTSIFG